MYVVKRDGRQEAVHFDKITARLKKLSYGLSSEHCDPVLVSQKVCAGVYKGVTTSQLDELAAETAAAMTANHPDYASVSSDFSRVLVSVCLLQITVFDDQFHFQLLHFVWLCNYCEVIHFWWFFCLYCTACYWHLRLLYFSFDDFGFQLIRARSVCWFRFSVVYMLCQHTQIWCDMDILKWLWNSLPQWLIFLIFNFDVSSPLFLLVSVWFLLVFEKLWVLS